MGGMTSKPKAPTPPPPPPVVAMPDPEDTAKSKRLAQERMMSRSGREATILTDSSGKLGG